ncbi:acyl-CoA dehydrogenase family protein [Amycolatopsis kentuckyensis]|uniref:acyl-CoA dehydrogenase family protein n=1 Tax=Amycolatopsis kentuckyensis TaxID=218823 RepID=UPI000A393A5C|nr:acyl-CoA dehydrogenase family protein [Amycolatopsis kentuckyensis]
MTAVSLTRPAPPRTAPEILARAKALAPVLRERAAEFEQARRLPPDVVELLRDTGVFRMTFPREFGGPELTSIEQTEVIEALSYGDASAGWCAIIGSGTGLYAPFLSDAAAREMFPRLDLITAGMLFPAGRAERVPGGYRLTGRWTFGSGITHCDWVISGAFLYRDGKPDPSPDGRDPHDSRLFMVPAAEAEVIDNWHTTGLAGSGSCDYTITDVFVPEERTLSFDTVHGRPSPLARPESFMRTVAGVPLGVARAALDHVRNVVRTRVDRATGVPWADNWRMQVTLAECEADFIASRAGVYGTMREQWELLSAGAEVPAELQAALPLSRLHALRTARSVVARLYDLMQTGSIHRGGPLDRWLRDTTTMCQHLLAQDRILQSAGAHLLGGTPEFRLCLGITS